MGRPRGGQAARLPGPVPGSTLVGGEGGSLGQAAFSPSAALAFPSLRVRSLPQCQGQDAKRVNEGPMEAAASWLLQPRALSPVLSGEPQALVAMEKGAAPGIPTPGAKGSSV